MPFCVGWNGSGVAHTDVAKIAGGTPESYRSEAVCVSHTDRVEIVVAVPLAERGAGDGVLSLRFGTRGGFRDLDLPHVELVAHYHEYNANGSVRFEGTRVIEGFARLDGDPRGALELSFSGTFIDGPDKRIIETDSRLVALDWEPSGTTNRGSEVGEPVPEGYYEGGCSGTYYDYDEDEYADDDEYGYSQSYDDGGGCGGDDLDDDGPSASSGGCDGDDDFDSDDSYDSDDGGGCEGDDSDSYDSSDSDSGCEGDNVDAVVASCARSGGGGGGSPWVRRGVRWLPWMCVFLAIRLMRRRRRLVFA
jgi:hypothetical protein